MLPQRLRAARKNLKMTQDQLAKKLGRKNTTISNWESGHSHPSHADLVQLSEVLEVSMDYLLGKTDSPEILKDATDLKELMETRRVKWNGQELTREQLEKAKNILEYILDKGE